MIFSHFQKCGWCLTSSPEIGPQNLSQSNGKCISSGASVTGAWVLDKRFTVSYHNRKPYYLLYTPIMATELNFLNKNPGTGRSAQSEVEAIPAAGPLVSAATISEMSAVHSACAASNLFLFV